MAHAVLAVVTEAKLKLECRSFGDFDRLREMENGSLVFSDSSKVDGPTGLVGLLVKGRSRGKCGFILLMSRFGRGDGNRFLLAALCGRKDFEITESEVEEDGNTHLFVSDTNL